MSNVESVQMEDGSVVEFAGKRRMLKNSFITDEGEVKLQLDFRNGRQVSIAIPQEMILKFAAHGAEQKFGDTTAGLSETDDMIMAVEKLQEQINKGEWSAKRESNGMAGTSILLKALIEHTGKTVEQIKQFLEGKTQAEKLALRNNSKIRPIIARLEAEKNLKGTPVDTDAMLDELA